MPGFLTDYANNMVLDAFFGGQELVTPKKLSFGLSGIRANKAGHVREPQSNYERVTLDNDFNLFNMAVSGSKSNIAIIVFRQPIGVWGYVVSVFVADENRNVIAIADLPARRLITAESKPPAIAVSALSLSHI